MIRSGRSSGTWAARPSVNNSNWRISLMTEHSATSPSSVRMWLVTISVLRVGSSPSARSTTCTAHPARARREAAKNPEAEPPITATFGPDATNRFCLIPWSSFTFPRPRVTTRTSSASTRRRFYFHYCRGNAGAAGTERPPSLMKTRREKSEAANATNIPQKATPSTEQYSQTARLGKA